MVQDGKKRAKRFINPLVPLIMKKMSSFPLYFTRACLCGLSTKRKKYHMKEEKGYDFNEMRITKKITASDISQ